MVAREGFVYKQNALEGWSLVRVVVRQGFYCTILLSTAFDFMIFCTCDLFLINLLLLILQMLPWGRMEQIILLIKYFGHDHKM